MVGGAARETIKTHEAVIQGVAADYLPRVTTNIMWLIWECHYGLKWVTTNIMGRQNQIPTGKLPSAVLKDTSTAEIKNQNQ